MIWPSPATGDLFLDDNEISDYSGADVQVSKRGIYAPGTTNRIVSVKGSQVKSSLASE